MTKPSSKPILDCVKNNEQLKDSKTANVIEIDMDTVLDATNSVDSLEAKCLIIIVGSQKDKILGMATHMKTIFDIPTVEIVNDYATVQKDIENLDTSKGLVLFSSNINLDTMDKIIKSKTLLKSSHKMVLGDVVPLYIPKNALNDFYNNVKSKKLNLHLIKTWRTEEEQNESAREFVIKVAKKYRPAFWRQWKKHGICREIAYQQAEIRSKWAKIDWRRVRENCCIGLCCGFCIVSILLFIALFAFLIYYASVNPIRPMYRYYYIRKNPHNGQEYIICG